MKPTALDFVSDLLLPNNDDMAEFLDKLKGASDYPSKINSFSDNTPSAQVNAGSLTSFTERLSGQNKYDVQNSTLFAQLAADKEVDRYKMPMAWYKKYIFVLGQIGWNQPTFAFDSYDSGEITVKLDEAVLNILAQIATVNEINIVAQTMKALQALGDSTKQMLIWNLNSHEGSNGNFQIFPVDALPNGDVVMVLNGMQFEALTYRARFLWWEWESSSIQIQRTANKFILNDNIYSQVRQAIIDKLGDSANHLVADIPI